MFKKISSQLPSITLAILFGSIFYSVAGLRGFLDGHLGFAGPDLFATAMNLHETGYFLARGIFDDGSFNLYNHHPLIGFLVFSAISYFNLGYADQLMAGYTISAAITVLGWMIIYRVLQHIGFKKEFAALGVLVTASSTLFITYRATINFDCLSILCSGLLLFSISELLAAKNRIARKILWTAVVLFVFTFLVSWYAVPIVFISLAVVWYVRRDQNAIRRQISLIVVGLSFFLVLQIASMIVIEAYHAADGATFLQFLQQNASINKPPTERAFSNDVLAERLLNQFRELLPRAAVGIGFLLGLFIVWGVKRYPAKGCESGNASIRLSAACKDSCQSVIAPMVMVIGVLVFVAGTLYWSAIHPFALLYLAGPLAYLYAYIFARILDRCPIAQGVLLVIISASSIFLYGHQRAKDVKYAESTQILLTLVDHEFSRGYAFNWLQNGCNSFNPGALIYVASNPNRWLHAQSAGPLESQVTVECLDAEVGVMRFTTGDGKRQFIIKKNQQNYERR